MEATIRPFLEADERAVIQLWERCDLVVPWNDPARDVRRKLAVQRELFLVALVGDRIVGSVMAGYDGHRGWVNYLAVDPDVRRRGLGTTLMDAIEAELLAIGCAKINLQVRSSNPDAIAFYEAIGFRRDEVVGLGKRLIPDGPPVPLPAAGADDCVPMAKP